MRENQLDGGILDPGFIRRPDQMATMPPSSKDEIDAALAELQAKKDAWVNLDLREHLAILNQILEDLWAVAGRWVSVSVEAKGTRGNAYAEAEEWAMFSAVLRNVRLLGKSLRAIEKHGCPLIPGPITTRPSGQIVAQVFPQSRFDRFLLPGTTAEVWMQPGLSLDDIQDTHARLYQGGIQGEKVALVLGAGNASMLVPTDFLYKLFVEGQVAVLKFNPVNTYLGPVLKEAFQSLIDGGFLRIIFGGAEEGSYLCHRAFCGLFAETALEAGNHQEFLERAVLFANQTLWGNLTATIIAHPDSLDDEQIAA